MTQLARSAIVSTIDYHTAGEPFRIVTGGVPVASGRTVADRRVNAAASLDHIRRLLVQEPRGHPGMYGCFVTPPDDDGAEFGAIFFHQSGFSTACGHGTIALATWAVEAGLVEADRTPFNIDVPSGRVQVQVRDSGNQPAISFLNVPAWVHRRGLPIETPWGMVKAGIAFGGAFYASLPASSLGLRVDVPCLPQLIDAGLYAQLGATVPTRAFHLAYSPGFRDGHMPAGTHPDPTGTTPLNRTRAAGESYCLAHHLTIGENGQRTMMTASIRYLDELVKQDGQWLFAERRLMELDRNAAGGGRATGPRPGHARPGRARRGRCHARSRTGCGINQAGAARPRARPGHLAHPSPAPAPPRAASAGPGCAAPCGSRPALTASSRASAWSARSSSSTTSPRSCWSPRPPGTWPGT
jgi:hypothetical protein